jgi:hypothetical protein
MCIDCADPPLWADWCCPLSVQTSSLLSSFEMKNRPVSVSQRTKVSFPKTLWRASAKFTLSLACGPVTPRLGRCQEPGRVKRSLFKTSLTHPAATQYTTLSTSSTTAVLLTLTTYYVCCRGRRDSSSATDCAAADDPPMRQESAGNR